MTNIIQKGKGKLATEIPELRAGLEAGRAVPMWEQAVGNAIPSLRNIVPPGSRVLEVGYGDGLLTCYLCRELGWQVTGLDVHQGAKQSAERHAKQFGLEGRVEFLHGTPEETLSHVGQYDAVFIKTVLLYSSNLEEYARWLDWILSVLRPGGVFINFETGRANGLTQYYRRKRRRGYADLCLYTSQVEALYDSRFEIIDRRYYGGWSQFFVDIPLCYLITARIEEKISPRKASNCFIVAIIAQRPS